MSEAILNTEVTALSIMKLANKLNLLPKNYNAILTGVITIAEVIQVLDSLDANDENKIAMNFGNFRVGGISLDKQARSVTEETGDLSDLFVDGDPSGLDLEGIKNAVNASLLPDDVKTGLTNLLDQLRNGFNLSFPIFENPKEALFPLLLGQDRDLFRLEAHLNTSSDYDQAFGLPLGFDAGFFGYLKPDLDLTFGYDSNGFRTYLQKLFAKDGSNPAVAADLLNGFHFSDDTGFRLESAIGVQANVNALLFHAGVEGGVKGIFEIGVPDENASVDGKVRLRNGALGAHANLFSVSGEITAYLAASVGIGVDLPYDNFVGIEKKWELASRDLVKFNFDRIANPWYVKPPLVPALAIQDEETGVVTLNIGEGNTRAYMPEVTDEVYSIVSVPAEDIGTGHVITITFNGQTVNATVSAYK